MKDVIVIVGVTVLILSLLAGVDCLASKYERSIREGSYPCRCSPR